MATLTKKEVLNFIKNFNCTKREGNHGVIYNIYNKNGIQLNLKPIIIPRDKKNYFGDTGIRLLAGSFGISQQFFKKLLNGKKSIGDYERDVLHKK